MPHLKVAHLREQGQDMIIVPLESNFGYRSHDDQLRAVQEMQMRSRSAGLKGQVVPVWESGSGGMEFLAPQPWHPFFSGLDLATVWANVNKELSW